MHGSASIQALLRREPVDRTRQVASLHVGSRDHLRAIGMPQAGKRLEPDLPEDSHVRNKRGILADSSRFDRLVTDNLDFVWRSLRRCGVPDADVDDAAQQVFIVASEKLELIRPGKERPFLFGVAVRVASHARRSSQRLESARERFSKNPVESPPDPEHLTQQLEARDLLDQVLDTLPDDERAVFVLFELEELSVKEVAEMIDGSTRTVIRLLRRARVAFSKKSAELRELRGRGVV